MSAPSLAPPAHSRRPPRPPSAAAIEEGRTRFNRGLALYKDGDYKAALVEFKRAYEVAPAPRLLYNIGQADYQLQDYAGALDAFERYLAQSGAQVPADRRKQVTEDLAKLRARVGALEIATNVAGAEITVDDVVVGTTPLPAAVTVSAGSRRVGASLSGHTPASKVVEIAGGDHAKVALDLETIAPAAPIVVTAPAAPVAPPPAPSSSVPVWIGVAATGALTATAVVFGVLTMRANDTYQNDLGQFPGDASAISSARDKVHTLALVTDLVTAGAIVALGVTVTLGLVKRSHDRHAAQSGLVIRF